MQEIELQRHPDTGELIPEEWKEVKGFPAYDISNYGRVRSWYNANNKLILDRDKDDPLILKQKVNRYGYYTIGLYHNRKRKDWLVHRLVCMAFHENPENKPQINHKDGDKLNNFYLNLEWATAKENTWHSINNGFHSVQGEDHHCAILKEEDIIEIRKLYNTGNFTQQNLADKFGVTRSNIGRIVRRDHWTHIPKQKTLRQKT